MRWTYELRKEDSDIFDKANPKQKKKLKKLLQSTQPTEYMGQDFTKLGDLLEELKGIGVNKSSKKMQKKFDTFEEANLDMVAAASELRKEYEILYRQLRGMVYPKSKGDLGDEKDE
tara:strand:- start:294 stop:641 length:348 start_codon:yes stop_codon:yes gene_type:complete